MQSMQVYMKSNLIYSFNEQKMFRTRYMARNNRSSLKYRRYNEKNMG